MTASQLAASSPKSGDVGRAARALAPLAVDVAVPLALYLGARHVGHLSVVDAYLLSSAAPVMSALVQFVRERRVNAVALLMLAVNLAGIALTVVTGSIRIGTAKSAAVSGVVAVAFVVSALRGRPLLSPAARAWITRGERARDDAWDRLGATSAGFRALDARFTLVMGAALLAECATRVVASAVAPVSVLGWLPNVALFAGLVVGAIVAGNVASDPMSAMVDDEVARPTTAG